MPQNRQYKKKRKEDCPKEKKTLTTIINDKDDNQGESKKKNKAEIFAGLYYIKFPANIQKKAKKQTNKHIYHHPICIFFQEIKRISFFYALLGILPFPTIDLYYLFFERKKTK